MSLRIPEEEMTGIRLLSAVKRLGNVMTCPILETALTAEEIAGNSTQNAVKKQHTKGVNTL